MELFKQFSIEAAHWLPNVPPGHKCRRMHGHSFQIEVHVSGPVDAELGWVMDFAEIKAAFAPIEEQIDHYCLNEIPGLENPTSENLARWIWHRLKLTLPLLSAIVIVRPVRAAACIAAINSMTFRDAGAGIVNIRGLLCAACFVFTSHAYDCWMFQYKPIVSRSPTYGFGSAACFEWQ